MIIAMGVALALSGQTAAMTGTSVDLICRGQADVSTTDTINTGPVGGPVNFATINGRSRLSEIVTLTLRDQDSRIRVPSSMTPSLRGRSDDGWRPIQELSVTDTLITGRFSFNPINKPSIRIDRITGIIEIKSLNGSFVGECQPVSIENRRF